jgi:plastocyanin
MKNYTYVPGNVTVKAGSVVTFYNDDVIEHSIVDDVAGGGDSGNIRAGSSFSILFTEPGEFRYHCRIHPAMRGTVTVVR